MSFIVRVVTLRAFVPALACLAFQGQALRGDEQPHPIAVQVKAGLADPTKPFALLVSVQAKDGAGEKLEAAFSKAIAPTRKEKGCLAYDLSREASSATQYLLYERWENITALEGHLKTDYITALLKDLEQHAASSNIRILIPAGD